MAILSMANVVVMIRVLVMLYAHGHAESQTRRCRRHPEIFLRVRKVFGHIYKITHKM